MEKINLNLTKTQKKWLKELLNDEADNALARAKNNHIWAMGSKTNEEATEHELIADELRGYAKALFIIWESIQEDVIEE